LNRHFLDHDEQQTSIVLKLGVFTSWMWVSIALLILPVVDVPEDIVCGSDGRHGSTNASFLVYHRPLTSLTHRGTQIFH